jgi:chemotaxis protein methyltransferase WspC
MKIHTLLRRQTGLNLTVDQVDRAVRQRMRTRGLADKEAYAAALSPQELDELAELVVVPESWMFRDPDSFRAACELVRARLDADPASTVRILSMPCAGGEEPYTMAMALFDVGVPAHAYRIDAVDLSREAIASARRASFSQNAFRGTELAFRDRYFTQDGARYQLSDRVRAQVDFRQGNLLTLDVSAAAGTYNVIFCRNLLIYFDDPTVAMAAAQLRTLLADDGILLAGHAEMPAFCRHGFASSRDDGSFVLRKVGAPAPSRIRPFALRPLQGKTLPQAAMAPASALRLAPIKKPPAATAPAATAQLAPKPQAPTAPELLALAQRCADSGQPAQALQHCEAALATGGELPQAHYLMGLVSASMGQPDTAFDHWRRCVYLEPGHYEALCHLALLAFDKGDANGADAYRQRAARVFARRADSGSAR